ncbi:hypothetical protein ACFV6E_10090 [Streptomyces sp. NPDC059785]|uniref:hypothetical protein n=1 Tax=Streptomyces sp. NPDC059785 TaxID=3346945 RepID=UPI0036508D04
MNATTNAGTNTTSVRPAAPRALSRTRGLVRTVLRLHRHALWIWLAYMFITAALLLWLYGPGATNAQEEFDTYGYYPPGGWDTAKYAYDTLFYQPQMLISMAAFVVPLFAAGSLTGREIENGTAQFAWSQSTGPVRWLAAKLAVPAVLLTAGTTLLVVLYRLLWSAHNGLLIAGYSPRELYFSIGPSTVALPLLGLAVGALCGLVIGRALPALAVAAVLQYLISAMRGRLWPFQHSTVYGELPELPVRGGPHRTYLASPDYWPRQLLETGVLLAVTALVVALAFYALRRKVTTA